MKTPKMPTNLLEIKQELDSFYNDNLNLLNELEKADKRKLKKSKKEINGRIKKLYPEYCFFGLNFLNKQLHTLLLKEAIQYKKDDFYLSITSINRINIDELLKDKDFSIYFRKILLMHILYETYKTDIIDDFNPRAYHMYFGNMESILLSYCLLNERNMKLNTLQNILSYIFKGSVLSDGVAISSAQHKTLMQIFTGIKEEKLKIETGDNYETRGYIKKEKFSILEKVKRSITIHYYSGKNGKHSFHSSPISHERQGHYRTLKSGKVIWIGPMVINPDGRVA